MALWNSSSSVTARYPYVVIKRMHNIVVNRINIRLFNFQILTHSQKSECLFFSRKLALMKDISNVSYEFLTEALMEQAE